MTFSEAAAEVTFSVAEAAAVVVVKGKGWVDEGMGEERGWVMVAEGGAPGGGRTGGGAPAALESVGGARAAAEWGKEGVARVREAVGWVGGGGAKAAAGWARGSELMVVVAMDGARAAAG